MPCKVKRKIVTTKQANTMKTSVLQFFTAALLCLSQVVAAQSTSNLEVFSESGETFTLTVNGVRYNDAPAANVKATGLTGDFARVMIQFSDASLGNVSQNIMLTPGTELRTVVRLGKKGYVLRPFGEPVAIGAATAATPVAPAPAPEPVTAPRTERVREIDATAVPATQTTITTTTTTTTQDDAVKMDIGFGDVRMGIDVRVTDGGMGTATTVRTTETTTISTTVTDTPSRPAPAERSRTAPAQADAPAPVPACGPMAGADFADAKRSISSKSFEESKLTTARQVLRGHCMSTDQIKEVMGLFSFEETKVTFAKAAYERCSDKANFWKLNDAFTFESSIDELNEFIEKK
jgi:hypothetical protein